MIRVVLCLVETNVSDFRSKRTHRGMRKGEECESWKSFEERQTQCDPRMLHCGCWWVLKLDFVNLPTERADSIAGS